MFTNNARFWKMVVAGLFLATILPLPVEAQTVSWKRQLGTSSDDGSLGVATDGNGNVYTSGYTYGSLAGPHRGGYDAWVAKHNSIGNLVWKRQLGTPGADVSYDVATDRNGNVYISGSTKGSLGGANADPDYNDAWVAKYNSSGTLLWKRQLGTPSGDVSYDVATDRNGNVYISGSTDGSLGGVQEGYGDAWVAKYNTNGTLLWKRQLGTTYWEYARGVATDRNGNVYISGHTNGSLAGSQGGKDAWVAKYNTNGTLLWKRQLGTTSTEEPILYSYWHDASFNAATDSNGNVYISGASGINYCVPSYCPSTKYWIAKYNSSGILMWKRQLTRDILENGDVSVATDSNGDIYISGSTGGSFGEPNRGGEDAWVAKYNTNGTLLWKRQLGTTSDDFSEGVAIDRSGNIYLSGQTGGSLGGANQGASDAWVVKYTQ